jgi:8-oxo-dGTP diphosphatase
MLVEHESSERPGVAAAVIVKEGKVLLVRRRIKEGKLSWQFPAGEVEAGESQEEAAVRETLEEVRLTVRAVRSLGSRVHPLTGRSMSYTACEVVSGVASVQDLEELDAIEWCSRAKLGELVPYPFYEPVQEHLDATVMP